MKTVQDWYEDDYSIQGIVAQRLYPNEELCRFIGRNYFNQSHLVAQQRRDIRILEVGCGSCANLWMLAREGFDAYGCDISKNAITVGREILEKYAKTGGGVASLSICNMTTTPYTDTFFDAVVDVFSSYCLCRVDYRIFLKEMYRILKPSGKFFSFFPSKRSDTFQRSKVEERYDEDTLNGNNDILSPYCGNDYFFRFMSLDDVKQLLDEAGFSLHYLESCGRTYRFGKEYFEWLVFEAAK